jgi:hypothetical protein
MKETITHEVVDNWNEHSQHLVIDPQCSECYIKPNEVEVNKEGYISVKK